MGKDQIGILIIENDSVAQQQIAQSFQDNPLIHSIEIVRDTDAALLKIIDQNPDLIFLEIPVKGKTGTGIIKFIQSKLPDTTIVFVSKSKKYAIEAIHHEIYDYLLKPVKKADLLETLRKVELRKQTNSLSRIKELIENEQEGTRLRFNTIRGFTIVNPEEIIYCKADGAYTELHLTNKSIEITFLYMSKVEEILIPYNFVRVSRSMIINKNYIRKIYITTNTLVLSSNGVEYEIKGSKLPIRALSKIK